MEYFYIGNTTQAIMENFRFLQSGNPDNGASLGFTIYDTKGVEVPNQTWPIPMSNVDSEGTYIGTIPGSLSVSLNHKYTIEVVGVSSTGEDFKERHTMQAVNAGGAC